MLPRPRARSRCSASASTTPTSSTCGPGSGSTSAAVADQVPPAEKVIDLVLTASYGILGRDTEDYDSVRRHPRGRAARRAGLRAPDQAPVRHPVRGRAQAGPDRPGADARPGDCCCSTSPRPGWTWAAARTCCGGSPRWPATRKAPMMVLVTHHVEEVPDGLHPRDAAAPRLGARGRPGRGGVHRAEPVPLLRRPAGDRAPPVAVDGACTLSGGARGVDPPWQRRCVC